MKRIHALLSILLVALVTGAWVIKDTAGPIEFYTGSNTTPSLKVTTAGVVESGLAAALNYNAPASTLNGALQAGGTTSATDEFRLTGIFSNAYHSSFGGTSRLGTTVGGVGILLSGRASNGAAALSFITNQAADGNTTAAQTIGSATQQGGWILGHASTGPSTGLTVRADGSSTLVVNRTTSSGALSGVEFQGGGVKNGRLLSNSTNALTVEGSSGSTILEVDQEGGTVLNNVGGFWSAASGTGTTSAESQCVSGDGTAGFDSGSGHCLFAWNSGTGASVTCGDVTSIARKFICVGYR